jgi:hypothetical protein
MTNLKRTVIYFGFLWLCIISPGPIYKFFGPSAPACMKLNEIVEATGSQICLLLPLEATGVDLKFSTASRLRDPPWQVDQPSLAVVLSPSPRLSVSVSLSRSINSTPLVKNRYDFFSICLVPVYIFYVHLIDYCLLVFRRFRAVKFELHKLEESIGELSYALALG